MDNRYTTKSADETRALGTKLAGEILPGTLVCLSGDLGAGKTTFVQGFLAGLGAERPYTSPTFVIMKQYDLTTPSKNGIARVYHADAYRVETKDFETLGFTEWCEDKQGVVILEWPERVKELLPPERTEIVFKNVSENEREIRIK
jgi:tRNA threonylcarbamoyladenosine biosynthesis protein TsaE